MVEDCEFYWKVLDAIEDGVYFTNKDRKITYWNKGAEKITGYAENLPYAPFDVGGGNSRRIGHNRADSDHGLPTQPGHRAR